MAVNALNSSNKAYVWKFNQQDSTPFGSVYYVNTLVDNSTGNSTTHEGSLRWCLSQTGKRTILFKVSGIITLGSNLH
ncbi:MAG TPA: hypothetical protein VIK20_05095 [Bacteroidales bacterium]